METIKLKTGFDMLLDNTNDDSHLHIMSLLTVFMQNALENASIYTKHSNRTIVTSKDISLALKREVFEFLNCEDLEIRAKEILNTFINEDKEQNHTDEEDEDEYDEDEYDEDEYDEDDEDEYEEEYEEEYDEEDKKNTFTNKEEVFSKSICNCKICVEINKYNEKWNTWTPTNKIEEILYNGILKIDKTFNL